MRCREEEGNHIFTAREMRQPLTKSIKERENSYSTVFSCSSFIHNLAGFMRKESICTWGAVWGVSSPDKWGCVSGRV